MALLRSAAILCALVTLGAARLPAAAVKKNRLKFSLSVATDCLKNGGNEKACAALALAADPPGDGIAELSLTLQYDPARWTFDAGQSGFLCSFSVGGGCPSSNIPTGSVLVSTLPTLTATPGAPLPGSTVSIVNNASLGLVTLSYVLAAPTDFSGDQNFFSFYFLAKTPFDATQTLATFHNNPGVYDFTQATANCVAVINGAQESCGSDTPVDGIDFTPIPEPRLALAMAAAFGVATAAMAARRRRLNVYGR